MITLVWLHTSINENQFKIGMYVVAHSVQDSSFVMDSGKTKEKNREKKNVGDAKF